MEVVHLISGPIDNNAYVAFDKNKNCVIIDAPFDCYSKIHATIEKYSLNSPEYILITHTHWDHIGGLAELKKNYPRAKIAVHENDIFRLRQPSMNLGGMEVKIEMIEPNIILQQDVEILCGNMALNVIHTPGHSPGAVCYYNENAKILFSGDTLFKLSIGRTDFPGCSYPALINSIKTKLWQLDQNTTVYPGHNESTTIKFEKNNNPFLNVQN